MICTQRSQRGPPAIAEVTGFDTAVGHYPIPNGGVDDQSLVKETGRISIGSIGRVGEPQHALSRPRLPPSGHSASPGPPDRAGNGSAQNHAGRWLQ